MHHKILYSSIGKNTFQRTGKQINNFIKKRRSSEENNILKREILEKKESCVNSPMQKMMKKMCQPTRTNIEVYAAPHAGFTVTPILQTYPNTTIEIENATLALRSSLLSSPFCCLGNRLRCNHRSMTSPRLWLEHAVSPRQAS